MKRSDDQTLFAWAFISGERVFDTSESEAELCGPLATSPFMFRGCSELVPLPDSDVSTPYSMTNKGIRFELPIIRHDNRRALAILQCSTTTTYPRNILLPIVQVNREDNGHFARNGRYRHPLKTAKPHDKLTGSETKVIYMKQEPGQALLWRRTVAVTQYNMRHSDFYRQLYSSPKLVPRADKTSISNSQDFIVPSGYDRGAILYGVNEPDVLVLWSVKMQHQGRYSCKVLRFNERLHGEYADYDYANIQRLLSLIKENAMSHKDPRTRKRSGVDLVIYYEDIEHCLQKLHDFYTTGSSSSKSSCLEREQGLAVWASIAPQVNGKLALDIALLDLSKAEWPFHELPPDEARRDEDVETDEDIGIDVGTYAGEATYADGEIYADEETCADGRTYADGETYADVGADADVVRSNQTRADTDEEKSDEEESDWEESN
jgi:hypothetical protein